MRTEQEISHGKRTTNQNQQQQKKQQMKLTGN